MTNLNHGPVVKEKVADPYHLRFLAATAATASTEKVELSVEEIKNNELFIFDFLMVTHILCCCIQIFTFALKKFNHHNIA
jgi:hypothetical protein